MEKKAASAIMLTLLLTSMWALAFNIQPVKAEGTIYIRADGSIDPPTAPIQRNGDVYTLTGNITSSGDGIAIERDNMTLQGAAYTIQGSGAYPYCTGINVTGRMNVTIRNVGIRDFYYGVYLRGSSNNNVSTSFMKSNAFGILLADSSEHNSISGNNLANNGYGGIKLYSSSSNILVGNNIKAYKNLDAGITLGYSSNNSIVGNSMTNDQYGMWLYYSSNNSIHHNNFIYNAIQPGGYRHICLW